MLYWSAFAGASVHLRKRRIGHIESIMLDPDRKVVTGFLLERRNRDLRYRLFTFNQIQSIRRDSIVLKDASPITSLSRSIRNKVILADELLNQTILDEKGEIIGRVVDFAFSSENGNVREIIVSDSLLEDFWNGRKKMPVLSQVEFSRELILIDQDTKEEISVLDKGLKNWLFNKTCN